MSRLLFYANRRREDAPFLEELWALKNEDPGFTFVPTINGLGILRPRRRGETGRITLGMMMRHLPADMPTEMARGPVYYLAGPPGMVRGLTENAASGGRRRCAPRSFPVIEVSRVLLQI